MRDVASPDRRTYLRRAGEWGPKPNAEAAPQLPHADWPSERRAKALRNYAVGFTASRYTTLVELIGLAQAVGVIEQAWVLTLSQRGSRLLDDVGLTLPGDASTLGALLASFARLTGDTVEVATEGPSTVVERTDVKLWRNEDVAIREVDAAIGRAWARAFAHGGATVRCTLGLGPLGGYRWELHD